MKNIFIRSINLCKLFVLLNKSKIFLFKRYDILPRKYEKFN